MLGVSTGFPMQTSINQCRTRVLLWCVNMLRMRSRYRRLAHTIAICSDWIDMSRGRRTTAMTYDIVRVSTKNSWIPLARKETMLQSIVLKSCMTSVMQLAVTDF